MRPVLLQKAPRLRQDSSSRRKAVFHSSSERGLSVEGWMGLDDGSGCWRVHDDSGSDSVSDSSLVGIDSESDDRMWVCKAGTVNE